MRKYTLSTMKKIIKSVLGTLVIFNTYILITNAGLLDLKDPAPENIIAAVVKVLLIFAIFIGVLRIIEGGYYLMTSEGSEQKLTEGKEIVTSAVIGIIFGVIGVSLLSALLKAIIPS